MLVLLIFVLYIMLCYAFTIIYEKSFYFILLYDHLRVLCYGGQIFIFYRPFLFFLCDYGVLVYLRFAARLI